MTENTSPLPLHERTALVTGANRGIGLEIARQLAAAGVHVLAAAREPGAAEILLDVTRKEHIGALTDRLKDGLDILVNNADTALDGFNVDVAERTLDVNFFGAMNLTDALLPILRKGARVVMVSSGMGELSHVGAQGDWNDNYPVQLSGTSKYPMPRTVLSKRG
jgi:NAD(P)-dependent dehydrogenase (short-subunit alcohol dehydrogenase family)